MAQKSEERRMFGTRREGSHGSRVAKQSRNGTLRFAKKFETGRAHGRNY